ncbi:hypothetical protein OGATHE_000075 [Ogataea polymorpha]|uniref:Uncharacterized protein n=1 Tax=Ogataea polymorpha TaxID=460523 RepID=A0A9P8PUZ5_9ASCO|nr:hypothetical protein OGATHE_000075 [Ogataea polymorpha]
MRNEEKDPARVDGIPQSHKFDDHLLPTKRLLENTGARTSPFSTDRLAMLLPFFVDFPGSANHHFQPLVQQPNALDHPSQYPGNERPATEPKQVDLVAVHIVPHQIRVCLDHVIIDGEGHQLVKVGLYVLNGGGEPAAVVEFPEPRPDVVADPR